MTKQITYKVADTQITKRITLYLDKVRTISDLKNAIASDLQVNINNIDFKNPPTEKQIIDKNDYFILTVILKNFQHDIEFHLSKHTIITIKNANQMSFTQVIDEFEKNRIYFSDNCLKHYMCFYSNDQKLNLHDDYPFLFISTFVMVKIIDEKVIMKYDDCIFCFTGYDKIETAYDFINKIFYDSTDVIILNSQKKKISDLNEYLFADEKYYIKLEYTVYFSSMNAPQYSERLRFNCIPTVSDAKEYIAILKSSENYQINQDNVFIFDKHKKLIHDMNKRLSSIQKLEKNFYYSIDLKYSQQVYEEERKIKKKQKSKNKEDDNNKAKKPSIKQIDARDVVVPESSEKVKIQKNKYHTPQSSDDDKIQKKTIKKPKPLTKSVEEEGKPNKNERKRINIKAFKPSIKPVNDDDDTGNSNKKNLKPVKKSNEKLFNSNDSDDSDDSDSVDCVDSENDFYSPTKSTPSSTSLNFLDSKTIESFDRLEEVGSGGCGRVYKVYKDGTYALKEMNISVATQENFRYFFGKYELLCKLDHPNIVKAFGIFTGDGILRPCILLEFCKSNLESTVKTKTLNSVNLIFSLYQIAEGMKYVHAHKIIHRDLKPSNILIGSDNTIKISDFGIARLMTIEEQTSMTQGVGTQKYMAPEIINEEEKYDEKVDVYSFGVVALFVLNNGDVSKIKIGDIFKGKKIEIPDFISELGKELISDCLRNDAKDRPSFNDIVSHIESNGHRFISLNNSEIKELSFKIKEHKSKIPQYK